MQKLHSKLDLSITPQDFSNMLYDELSWQPKDLEGIQKIISKCPPESECIKILKSLSGKQSMYIPCVTELFMKLERLLFRQQIMRLGTKRSQECYIC